MIQTLKSYMVKVMMAAMLIVPAMAPAIVSADPIENGLCNGVALSTGDNGSCANDDSASTKVNGLIKLVINIFSLVVGVVAVIMIIIGGLKYITSSGDSNNVTSAKNTILYAVVGLVIVALAQFIVKFVLGKALNAGDGGE